MNNKPLTLLTALLASIICIGTADAKGNSKNHKPPVDEFKKLDKDHDGTLSSAEFAAGGKANTHAEFVKLDKNTDGKLDRYEFSLLHKKHH